MQKVIFFLLEGGDFQGYVNYLASPKTNPPVVKRDEAIVDVKVFNPIGRKVAREQWDRWTDFLPQAFYPPPSSTFPKAQWVPAIWLPSVADDGRDDRIPLDAIARVEARDVDQRDRQ